MKNFRIAFALAVACLAAGLVTSTAGAQAPTESDMEILAEKIIADKKLLVAANMELTEDEAAAFWPLYDEYNTDLAEINLGLADLVEAYATGYGDGTLTDEQAGQLLADFMLLEQAEVDLKRSFLPRFSEVLPAKKVARYYQIENKIRAAVKYQIAEVVPLVE